MRIMISVRELISTVIVTMGVHLSLDNLLRR